MEFSTRLIEQLHKIKIDDQKLRRLINEYIDLSKNYNGLAMVLTRGNYHYILDKIKEKRDHSFLKSQLINLIKKEKDYEKQRNFSPYYKSRGIGRNV